MTRKGRSQKLKEIRQFNRDLLPSGSSGKPFVNKVMVKKFSFPGNFFSTNASEDREGAIEVLKNPAPCQPNSSEGDEQ
jgi:hypothetical protein